MTVTELIENLADAYGLEMPEKNERGRYDLSGYYWSSGCYVHDRWLSLSDIVDALRYSCESDDD